MITSARSVRPLVRSSVRPTLHRGISGWHLVNRERRRHSPFCTNFGLPAASERARRKHHLHRWGLGHRFLSRSPRFTRARDSSRLSFSARAGSIMTPRLLGRVTLFPSPFSFFLVISSVSFVFRFSPLLIISFASFRRFTRPLFR